MTRVIISPRAESELEEIWLMFAADDISAATRLVRNIGERIEMLATYPRLGPRRPDIAPTARVLVEGRYLVIYEHHPNSDIGSVDIVEIVAVVDGRRDLARLI